MPPADTRAFFRGACLARWPEKVVSANWDGIVLDTAAGLVRLPMDEPLKGNKDLVGGLVSSATDVDHLVEMLGAGSVVHVEADPGW